MKRKATPTYTASTAVSDRDCVRADGGGEAVGLLVELELLAEGAGAAEASSVEGELRRGDGHHNQQQNRSHLKGGRKK